MKFSVRQKGRALVAVVAAAIIAGGLLTGCSSGLTPKATPTSGGTLQVANTSDAQPAFLLAGRQGNALWAANVFQTLTQYDSTGKPQPLLAKSWKVAGNGLSIDITLRSDVTFSSGRKLTADDVKFSFEKAIDPASGSQVAFIGKQFTAIDVESPTRLKITFAKPLSNLFDFFEQTFILDPQTFSGLADGSKVVGTGPFEWKSWDPGNKLVLVRNPNYWGTKPYLDEIDVNVITDSTAMINAVRSGRIQYALGLSGTDVTGFQNNPQFRTVRGSGSVYPLGLNVTTAPFDKVEVRQAIQYAIDRSRIAKQVFGGLATPTTQFWDKTAPGYDKKLDSAYAYDPKKAKKMLQDAGAEGAAFTINVIGLDPNKSTAEIVANNLTAVGLKPTVNVIDTNTFGPKQIAGDLGAAFMPLHGLNGYGPATLMNTLPSTKVPNPSKFDTPDYDKLHSDLATATSASATAAAATALAKYMVQQAFNLPLVNVPGYLIAASNAHGEKETRRSYVQFGSAYLGASK